MGWDGRGRGAPLVELGDAPEEAAQVGGEEQAIGEAAERAERNPSCGETETAPSS